MAAQGALVQKTGSMKAAGKNVFWTQDKFGKFFVEPCGPLDLPATAGETPLHDKYWCWILWVDEYYSSSKDRGYNPPVVVVVVTVVQIVFSNLFTFFQNLLQRHHSWMFEYYHAVAQGALV